MLFSARHAIRSGLALLAVSLLPQTVSGWCAVRTILVQGRVEDAARGASVTVELLYEHGQVGESDRLVLESPTFRTRIAFSTQSSSTDVMGHSLSRCKHVPKTVAVVLLEDDQEVDRLPPRLYRGRCERTGGTVRCRTPWDQERGSTKITGQS